MPKLGPIMNGIPILVKDTEYNKTDPATIGTNIICEYTEYRSKADTPLEWQTALINDGPDIKLFILVGLGRSFFVCCLAPRGSTVGFLLLQGSSGVVRHPRDLQVSVATRFCRVLIFASS